MGRFGGRFFFRLTPAYDPVGTLVRYAVGTDVDTVMVAGRVLVKGGRVLTIDEPALLPEAEALGTKLGAVLATGETPADALLHADRAAARIRLITGRVEAVA